MKSRAKRAPHKVKASVAVADSGGSQKGPIDAVAATRQFISYPRALDELRTRLQAEPEEVAAWVFMGPEHGGLKSYRDANEFASPRRFFFADAEIDQTWDYMKPLRGAWFDADEIAAFEPAERFITGAKLIERWSQGPDIDAATYVVAKIKASQLIDLHPICGVTSASRDGDDERYPPLENGLFSLAEIEEIEREEFGKTLGQSSETPEARRERLTKDWEAGMTMAAIGRREGITRQRVSSIIRRKEVASTKAASWIPKSN